MPNEEIDRYMYNTRLLLSMRYSLIQCIRKGGGHIRYDLQYMNL